ncbi:hypothetical protein LINPERPRIM_LOCUS22898, partial [Linum perenne]
PPNRSGVLRQQHQRAAVGPRVAEVVIGLVAQPLLGQMGENGSQGPIAIHHPAGKGIPSAAIKSKTLDRPYCLRIGNHSAIFSKSRKLDSKIKTIICKREKVIEIVNNGVNRSERRSISDGGGLDGKKQVDDNSESSNLSFYEIRRRKIQWLAVLKAKWKEADKQKKSMLASGELPTPNQTMSKIALPTTVTGKRKAPESCDMLKSVKLPKGKEELHGTMAAFFSEKWPATESHASYEEIMGKSRREIIYSLKEAGLKEEAINMDFGRFG